MRGRSSPAAYSARWNRIREVSECATAGWCGFLTSVRRPRGSILCIQLELLPRSARPVKGLSVEPYDWILTYRFLRYLCMCFDRSSMRILL